MESGLDYGQGSHTINIIFNSKSWTTVQGIFKGEWVIIGGTGKFTHTQGAIFYDVVKKADEGGTGELKELHIGIVYAPAEGSTKELHTGMLHAMPLERSTLSDMFCEFNPSEVDHAVSPNNCISEKGSYGNVYEAVIRGIHVAVKTPRIGSPQGVREFNQEVESLRSIRHENLVRLVGACSPRRTLFYEFCHNGTLLSRLKSSWFSWEKRVRVAISICSALEFLHSVEICHRDLKPSNILFDAEDVCKLGDFGLSRRLKSGKHITPSRWPKYTRYYVDPEFRRTRTLTARSDEYALGIILLQLVTGKRPSELRDKVYGVLKEAKKQNGDNQAEEICKLLLYKKLKLDEKSKLDAVKMLRLGLKCSNAKGEDRPELAAEVRPELESMISGASGSRLETQKQPLSN
ncbi:hypothetical protein C2845_PM07G25330 [Panicum miliaceum]|uniref:RING-type E3 ubiquitin transferase n=1 Tax=Panicum miliaceum TaxID=4540 RepID=A0A3L6SNN8_PANMI|nr:hypothetical protein C2845_PM07G25330 [Panicum miliaceum]